MAQYICTHCEYMGSRKRVLKGTAGIELMIWALLLVPGPLYSIWRRFPRRFKCPQCNKEDAMVSMESGVGQAILKRQEAEILGGKNPENMDNAQALDAEIALKAVQTPKPKRGEYKDEGTW